MVSLQKFNELLEQGWDMAIDYIATIDCPYLQKEVARYNQGYELVQNDDIDGGVCFKLRSMAIKNILAILEREEELRHEEHALVVDIISEQLTHTGDFIKELNYDFDNYSLVATLYYDRKYRITAELIEEEKGGE